MPKRKSTPSKWNDYSCFKGAIDGTRIIPFKTPLKESVFLNQHYEMNWSPNDVMNHLPNLGLVINLCFAQNPYYLVDDFTRNGVNYVSIRCLGQAVPPHSVVQKFASCVKSFLLDANNDDKIIGVHCTHGVNRTGYVVCHYLIDELKMEPRTAVQKFEMARGHAIDRQEYIDALHDMSL